MLKVVDFEKVIEDKIEYAHDGNDYIDVWGYNNAANDCYDLAMNHADEFAKGFAEWITGFENLSQAIKFHDVKTTEELLNIYKNTLSKV